MRPGPCCVLFAKLSSQQIDDETALSLTKCSQQICIWNTKRQLLPILKWSLNQYPNQTMNLQSARRWWVSWHPIFVERKEDVANNEMQHSVVASQWDIDLPVGAVMEIRCWKAQLPAYISVIIIAKATCLHYSKTQACWCIWDKKRQESQQWGPVSLQALANKRNSRGGVGVPFRF